MFNSMLNNITPEKVGTIKAYGGSTAPVGWLICDGSAISRELYAELFGVIGTTYGAGDGSTTFNIPNGVIPVGSVAPAKGNGISISITDGTYELPVLLSGFAGTDWRGVATGSAAQNGGPVGVASVPQGPAPYNITTGLTTDPAKSGIICDLTLASAASTAIIKY